MIKQGNFLVTILIIVCVAFYSCNSDNEYSEGEIDQSQTTDFQLEEVRKKGRVNEIEYHPNVECPLSGPSCVLPGGTTTFTITCNDANTSGNVYWSFQQGVGISAILGSNGLGGASQAFTFSSNFTGGWIQGVCDGSFGCKDNIVVLPCTSPPPSCSISGPNCGVNGDVLTYSLTGGGSGQSINWSSSAVGLTLISGQGTNTASFQVGSSFSGGSIVVSSTGCPTLIFPITDCCSQRILTIDSDNRMLIQ